MHYNFDTELPRHNTQSVKWSLMHDETDPTKVKPTTAFFGEHRVLPMWVADMDFPCAQPVVEALVARAQHGIYGYTYLTEGYFNAIMQWMQKRHGWSVAPEWICTTPGIVPALNLLVRTFVAPGEKVLIQPPVYYPFSSAVKNNGAVIVNNPLRYSDGRYEMDFDHLEAVAQDPQVKMAILCNPHNPVGRVWTRAELTRFADICLRHNVLMVADEIHGDLILSGHTFTPLASLSPEIAQRTIACTAASKTFNLAGLHISNLIIANPELFRQFNQTLQNSGLWGASTFGVVAVEAAYTHGADWLTQVLAYLEGNWRYLQTYVAEHLPGLTAVPLEGTYLVWLDCRALGMDKDQLRHWLFHEARVYLNEGEFFGEAGEGFARMNIACPRPLLVEALERLRQAVAAR